jgi:hypothetical protein
MKRFALPAAATAALLAFACGPLTLGAQASPVLPTLSLTLTKTSITVAGATQSGAVNVVSKATGTKEATAILFLLKPGVSMAEVNSFLASKEAKDPNGSSKYGTIVFDAEVNPGQPSEAQTSLQAGQYLALIGEGEGGPKVKTTFTVSASPSPATLPAPEATIRSIEFGFRGPSTLHDGELVRFENEGYLVHMDVVVPTKSRKTAKELAKALLTGKEKRAEKLIAGQPFGVGPLSHGAFQQETITAKPGWYVQVCFMETQDGRDHALLGMERVINIVK